MINIGTENFYIELIEKYPCECRDELRAREGTWIRQIGTLNARIEFRSKEEWYNDNKELLNEKDRQRGPSTQKCIMIQTAFNYSRTI